MCAGGELPFVVVDGVQLGGLCISKEQYNTLCSKLPAEKWKNGRQPSKEMAGYALVDHHRPLLAHAPRAADGLRMPSVYCERSDGRLERVNEFDYNDFKRFLSTRSLGTAAVPVAQAFRTR